MTPKLILHIGHGKTGTSYIQSVLASNTDYLKTNGIRYPEHASFDSAKEGKVSSGNGSLFLDGIALEGTTLFSFEKFFHALASDEQVEELVLPHAADVQILLYTRNVFEMISSAWGQDIKRGGGTLDIDAYMSRRNDPHHRRVLWWLEASKRYGFDCKVRNYSLHRKTLIDTFFTDLMGEQGESYSSQLTLPENSQVNRSLTVAEYKIQLEFNKNIPHTGSYISDSFVNLLPSIKSETPLISPDTYDKVVQWIEPTIEKINQLIDPSEAIKIETLEEIQASSVGLTDREYRISGDQIEALVASVSEKIISYRRAAGRGVLSATWRKFQNDVFDQKIPTKTEQNKPLLNNSGNQSDQDKPSTISQPQSANNEFADHIVAITVR